MMAPGGEDMVDQLMGKVEQLKVRPAAAAAAVIVHCLLGLARWAKGRGGAALGGVERLRWRETGSATLQPRLPACMV